ncbi:DUF1279 domain-containing protein [Chloropicon primus]|uniref:DUF1279 domain-containing protein n=1 Tax=Chloropicon primus TaxID=1764295 RepID=A0A5B8MBX1_9CHLO|nr:DUF1279 domain-containing protein [Chloropicon primus]UPQ97163.1 DUF1279 domain-containing protein [Chloropicon primus]|eukprot:QDZ17948.1 DUF1279 domain-containing protein [Chloropicon primus]
MQRGLTVNRGSGRCVARGGARGSVEEGRGRRGLERKGASSCGRSNRSNWGSTKVGVVRAQQEEEEDTIVKTKGLEYGLFKTLTDKTKSGGKKKADAKSLLTKYGPAYLVTSISFAIVSFALCYFLVSIGVDITALLEKIGLSPSSTSEKVGRFAIAYAAHKAASPIRFPPTVALTPVVAQLMGRDAKSGKKEETEDILTKTED